MPDRSLSLAIGKEGQNARLAAKLTGWRIDIKSETEAADEAEVLAQQMAEAEARARELETQRRAAVELLAQAEALLDDESDEAEDAADLVAEPLADLAAVAAVEVEAAAEFDTDAADDEDAALASAELEPELAAAATETDAVAVEAQGEGAEAAAAAGATPEPDEEWLKSAGDEELTEEDDSERGRGRKKGRRLEYDEKLGRVVARKQHKTRGGRDWSSDWED